MSGGRFLVSSREVLNSERILSWRSIIKENINIWEENIDSDAEESLDSINDLFDERGDDFMNDLFDERADDFMEAVLDDTATCYCQVATSCYQAMLPKSSSNEVPVTYVSKPWHHKKMTLKTIPIWNRYPVVDCLYHQDNQLILFVVALLF